MKKLKKLNKQQKRLEKKLRKIDKRIEKRMENKKYGRNRTAPPFLCGLQDIVEQSRSQLSVWENLSGGAILTPEEFRHCLTREPFTNTEDFPEDSPVLDD